jgi:cytidylate kinase
MISFAVAIDGPGGAGKSSIAKEIAKRLRMVYIDTGAMYRAVGLYNIRQGNDVCDAEAVSASLSQIDIKIIYENGEQRLLLNGEDVTEALRTQQAAESASMVAPYTPVREYLLGLQRDLAKTGHVVMDGRDIGSHVLPQAQVKIYLDANLEERVRRRICELNEKGITHDPDAVKQEIKDRDERDIRRENAPLTRAEDAVYMDTSGISFDEAVDRIIKIIRANLTYIKSGRGHHAV